MVSLLSSSPRVRGGGDPKPMLARPHPDSSSAAAAEPGRRPVPPPSHPPYALMIGDAIRSLDDRRRGRGSTESEISRYIQARFDGLPSGHENLLPYYLGKLTDAGEFVRGPRGRYFVARGESPRGSEDEGEAEVEEGDLSGVEGVGGGSRRAKLGSKLVVGEAGPEVLEGDSPKGDFLQSRGVASEECEEEEVVKGGIESIDREGENCIGTDDDNDGGGQGMEHRPSLMSPSTQDGLNDEFSVNADTQQLLKALLEPGGPVVDECEVESKKHASNLPEDGETTTNVDELATIEPSLHAHSANPVCEEDAPATPQKTIPAFMRSEEEMKETKKDEAVANAGEADDDDEGVPVACVGDLLITGNTPQKTIPALMRKEEEMKETKKDEALASAGEADDDDDDEGVPVAYYGDLLITGSVKAAGNMAVNEDDEGVPIACDGDLVRTESKEAIGNSDNGLPDISGGDSGRRESGQPFPDMVADDGIDEGVPIACEGDLVKTYNNKAVAIVDASDIDDGVPIACDGDVVMELWPPLTSGPTSKRRGRPPKRKWRIRVEGEVQRTATVQPESSGHIFRPLQTWPATITACKAEKILASEQTKARSEKKYGPDGSVSVPKRRGRPPKRMADSAECFKGASGMSLFHVEGIASEDIQCLMSLRNKNDAMKLVPRRQGRPPKRKHELVDSSKEIIIQGADVLPLQIADSSMLGANGSGIPGENVDTHGNHSNSAPKRKGRQPKRREMSRESFDQNAPLCENNLAIVPVNPTDPESSVHFQRKQNGTVPEPKRRGRPPKSKLVLEVGQDDLKVGKQSVKKSDMESSSSVPKRRGRPPKPKPDAGMPANLGC